MLRQCGFRDVVGDVGAGRARLEAYCPRSWPTDMRRVPDILATDPNNGKTYVVDVRIAWNITTGGAHGYATGDLAAAAEGHKRHGDPKSSWSYALQHHPDLTNGNHVFVPFGAEISGSIGPAAAFLMKTALGWANSMHETDLYHWSAPSFERYWTQRLGMTLLRGRGDVGLAAATRACPAQHARTGVHSTAPEPEGLA
eukprot:SAG11_NODE_281_length_11257_cov_45.949633_5_plen_198_part_00